jgi:Glyoxalase-like domain
LEVAIFSRRSFLHTSCAILTASQCFGHEVFAVEPTQPDHIILGCRDLDEGIDYTEKLSGYRAARGGSHPGRGTRNALLKMGTRSYLEILAPDPDQPELRWHKEIANLSEPMLIGWAVETKNLDSYAARLRAKGIACIGPTPGSRTTLGGEVLRWQTVVLEDDKYGILPFHIDWAEDSPHPATTAPGACLFRGMTHIGHVNETPPPGPDFERMTLPETPAQLIATIAGNLGEFALKSASIPSEAWTKHRR